MLAPLKVTDRDFELLAAGSGDSAAIETLQAGQFSRRVLLLMAVFAAARQRAPGAVGTLEAAYTLLADVQRTHPGLVRSVLTLPCTGIWAAACLRGDADPGTYRYLACLAAAAAAAAGQEFEIEAPVLDGLVGLPATGSAAIDDTSAVIRMSRRAGLVITGSSQTVYVPPGASAEAPGWRPDRLLQASAAGHHIAVWLDDHSPFRAPPGIRLAPAVSPAQAVRWQETLTSAWRILARRHPAQIAAMAMAFRVLTPLSGTSERSDSATALEAFGAVLLTRPGTPKP
jgi:HEXXH motif-containing protein